MKRIEKKLMAQIAVLCFALSLVGGLGVAHAAAPAPGQSTMAPAATDKLDINTATLADQPALIQQLGTRSDPIPLPQAESAQYLVGPRPAIPRIL